MQSSHSTGTWNNEKMNNSQNSQAYHSSRGTSQLRHRGPVQAVVQDACTALSTISQLTTPLFTVQIGNGHTNCLTPHNCLLCNHEPLLHTFHSTQNQQTEMTTMEQDINLLPCSLAIVKAKQWIPTSIPFWVLFDSRSDNTFIHQKHYLLVLHQASLTSEKDKHSLDFYTPLEKKTYKKFCCPNSVGLVA
jgi:hypothetical protein